MKASRFFACFELTEHKWFRVLPCLNFYAYGSFAGVDGVSLYYMTCTKGVRILVFAKQLSRLYCLGSYDKLVCLPI